ncbi:hypothetical protein DV738_g1658, partial [Chaetothyriales sp. CBS 135597]
MDVNEAQLQQLQQLNTLVDALESASDALDAANDNNDAFIPPTDGLSLLDTKNSMLLSYLQSLVFLILVQLRDLKVDDEDESFAAEVDNMKAEAQQKLNELRIYLDRGVRPIESRLKYQIDSALRAAETDQRNAHAKDEAENALLYKPNLSLPRRDKPAPSSKDRSLGGGGGVYKAPRMNPTAMPDPDKRDRDRTHEPRKRKSQLLNEYIDEELSSTPRAQPSIGSNNTILDMGRGGLSQRDREKERERTEYEERNFTRLREPSKKERREARRKGQLNNRDVFGGEDWTGLGGLGDRLSKSVTLGRRERDSVLKRREKRRATEDLPRGDGTGTGIGDSFEKKRRVLEARAERKAMKRR